MVYNNFRINFIVRVTLLTLNIFAFIYLLFIRQYLITSIALLALAIFQVVSLIHYMEKTNRVLINFLESIRYSDFSRTFEIEGQGTTFDQLKKSFNKVILDFQEVRSEKEKNYFYLQTVIQHIGIGLIAYQRDGNVELTNNALKKMFGINTLNNIKELREFNDELTDILLYIEHGQSKLVKIIESNDILQLSVYATEFKIQDRSIVLVSIKNIQQELEEKELEAWQQLIRVLTHEIMNSITPISSLSSTLNIMIADLKNSCDRTANEENYETLEEIEKALNTIHNRTEGLLHFVNTYRNLTKIPKPQLSLFQVKNLFNDIIQLMAKDLEKENIAREISIFPESLELMADRQLIEQVIINLLQNSIQALRNTKNKQLSLKGFINDRGKTSLQVIDNGQGIIEEVLDKVFVPFFTTKPKGSGIGLSLSKQIMRMHGGSINVQSVPDEKTRFTLTF